MALPFKPVPKLSSWRRIALHTWPPPRDPTVYSTLQIDMTAALRFLERLRRETGTHVTVTHLVAKAIGTALGVHPDGNAIVRGRWIYQRDSVDVFVQVATNDGEDLSGAKITHVDEKSVVEIARELQEKSDRIRAHRDPELERTKRVLDGLPHWLLGWTMKFTEFAIHGLGLDLSRFGIAPDPFGAAMVSNVGTFGIDWALAPIVPFSRCPIVLLVGTVQPRPLVVEGQVVARPVLVIGTTFDHRLLDGAQAGRLARLVSEILTNPEKHLSSDEQLSRRSASR